MDLIANISAQINASKASLETDQVCLSVPQLVRPLTPLPQHAFTNGQTGAIETTYLSVRLPSAAQTQDPRSSLPTGC